MSDTTNGTAAKRTDSVPEIVGKLARRLQNSMIPWQARDLLMELEAAVTVGDDALMYPSRTLQDRVNPWLQECFGEAIANDTTSAITASSKRRSNSCNPVDVPRMKRISLSITCSIGREVRRVKNAAAS